MPQQRKVNLQRGPGAKSDLTGPDIKQALACMGVSHQHFSRLSGMNSARLLRFMAGTDTEAPPLFVELALFILYHHHEYRHGDGVLDLPFNEWGILIED